MPSDDFIFISYKSDDRARIEHFTKYLDAKNIKYWWDQQINVDWSVEIGERLTTAKLVVGFITDKTIASDAVLVEFRSGKKHNKLIPVFLDNPELDYAYSELLVRLNYINLSDHGGLEVESKELRRLFEKVDTRFFDRVEERPTQLNLNEESEEILSSWIKTDQQRALLPYLLSLCVFEYKSDFVIQRNANILESLLIEAGYEWAKKNRQDLISTTEKLKRVKAEILEFDTDLLPEKLKYVKFKDEEFKVRFLDYVWAEVNQLRDIIVVWLNIIVKNGDDAEIEWVALTLVLLAQKDFNSIYLTFIKPWLNSNNDNLIMCADIALSSMIRDDKVKKYIKNILHISIDTNTENKAKLNDTISASKAKPESTTSGDKPNEDISSASTVTKDTDVSFPFKEKSVIAIRLACGYTGMVMPDVSINILKQAETLIADDTNSDASKKPLLNEIETRVAEFAIRASSKLYALAALKIFIKNLAEWISSPDEIRKTYIPEYIGLIILTKTKISKDNGRLSLDQLVDGIDNKAVLDALADLLARSLTSDSGYIKESAKEVIDIWCQEIKKKKVDVTSENHSFHKLLKLMHENAKTVDSKERIEHSVKSVINL